MGLFKVLLVDFKTQVHQECLVFAKGYDSAKIKAFNKSIFAEEDYDILQVNVSEMMTL